MIVWIRNLIFRLFQIAIIIYIFCFLDIKIKCMPDDCNKHETLSCIKEFFIIY